MSSCHDFVIKDGRFIGKFEEMYSKCNDPWKQSQKDRDFKKIAKFY